MSKAARSVGLFGIYLMLLGALLTLIPNLLPALLRLPGTGEVYIRIVGMLAFILGFYYLQASRHEITVFFRWTVHGRLAGLLMFCVLALGGYGPPMLLLFGVVDGAAALWTHRCLQMSEGRGSGVAGGAQ